MRRGSTSRAYILARLEVVHKLAKHGRPKKGEEKGDNITLKDRGTSRAYILALPGDR